MEIANQSIAVAVGKDIGVQFYAVLLVATEEVDLYSSHTNAAHPLHLGTSFLCIVNNISGREIAGTVPIAIGIIPQQQSHPFLLCISREFGYAFAANPLVPESVDKAIAEAQFGRHVDKLARSVISGPGISIE